MAIINHMMKKIDTDVANLKQGLHPQNLSYWYGKIIKETIAEFNDACRRMSKQEF